jgi:hypothetical protein
VNAAMKLPIPGEGNLAHVRFTGRTVVYGDTSVESAFKTPRQPVADTHAD